MITSKYDGLILELETARYQSRVLDQRVLSCLCGGGDELSIDGALSYINEHLPIHTFLLRDGYCELRHIHDAKFDVVANAATPTLAIWAAILKAERALDNANINS